MSDSQDDASHWVNVLGGDAASFGVLFDRHGDRVFRHAMYQLGNREDAEDAVASAFLELWRLRSRVRVFNGSILPWLLVTTTNLSRNLSRARRRYRELLTRLPRESQSPADTEELVQRRLDAQHDLSAAAPALARLRATDRALLTLTTVEELPIADVAVALGISEGAARVRLHRVKSRLRDQVSAARNEVDS
jgi:RNA polymerase sigma-70 factor (ECF subfamily)